jgi:membrane dipeptidase
VKLPRIPLTIIACIAVATLVLSALPARAQDADSELVERARAILAETPLVDGHNDLPWELRELAGGRLDSLDLTVRHSPDTLDTDLVRLREGMVGAQFFADYVPSDSAAHGARFALAQAALIRRLVARFPETFQFATTADEIEAAHEEGRIAALIGLEGGHAIEGSLDVLRSLYEIGVRYITLTHSQTHDWADSATDDPRHDGLSSFGELVVREMNRLGVMVDLSHVSEVTMMDALDVTRAPVIFSHSSTRALTDHPRNVPDAVLRRLPENGGIIMITFVPGFVNQSVRRWEASRDSLSRRLREAIPSDTASFRAAMRDSMAARGAAPVATLSDVADHIDHAVEIAGIDHVGIGSDFDGISTAPQGLEDVSTFPALLAELLRRGYSEEDVAKIAGRNALRVMRDVEAAAQRLQATEEPVVAVAPREHPDLSGMWNLRQGESIPPGERPRRPGGGGDPSGPSGGRPPRGAPDRQESAGGPEGGPPGMGVARTLTIAQSGFTVTFKTENMSDTYFTDGREVRRENGGLGPHMVRASWDAGDLIIERRGEARTITETYRFDERGPRLIVLSEIRGEQGAIRINRIYERAS